jgi:PKD repeat protein
MNKPTAFRRLERLRDRTTARAGRGQSLVEFALVLPVILLILLVTLDFGRIFLGYINVQNMARIAANYAANNPTAWGGTPNATIQLRYESQVLADASATNCALPGSVPAPAFMDRTGDGDANDLGDNAQVQITCDFAVITPLISSILGGTVQVTAESNFPVKTGMSAVAGGGGGGGPVLPTAAFIGNGVVSERNAPYPILSDLAPFDVEFRDTSGGSPNGWSWDFGDGTTSAAQDPLNHTFDCTGPTPCTYRVSMVVSNANGSSTAYMDIEVIPAGGVDFSANRTLIEPGMSVTFTDESTSGGTDYAWDFGDGATTAGTDTSPSHTYSTAGVYSVTLTVTYPDPTGPVLVTKTDYIRVEEGLCQVPDLNGVRFNSANAIYQGSPYSFTGTVLRDAGAPSGNFFINAQDLTAGDLYACTEDIQVTRIDP